MDKILNNTNPITHKSSSVVVLMTIISFCSGKVPQRNFVTCNYHMPNFMPLVFGESGPGALKYIFNIDYLLNSIIYDNIQFAPLK